MAAMLGANGALVTERVHVKSSRAAAPVAKLVVASESKEAAVSRRAAFSLAAGAAALVASRPAQAAYGEAANVFGSATNTSGYVPYAGDGYALLLPTKFNPSKEREFPGIDVRYEDNFDAVNTIMVLVKPAEKSKMEDYGTPEAFLPTLAPLLGQQAWQGDSMSEGGFAPGKVSVANVLTTGSRSTGGKTYYQYEVLTRTADGDEGGRHHIFATTVSGGKLYILKAQAGDKRWFKVSVHDAMPLFSLTQYPRVSSGTLSACRPLSPLFKILQSTPYAFLAV